MSKATVTVEGFVARDVELRVTQSGKRVATVVVPHTPRKKGPNGFEDAGPTTWYEADLWDDAADAVSQVTKGTYVVLTGLPQVETYEKRDGGVGVKVAVKFATVGVVRGPGGGQGGAGRPQTASAGDWATPAAFDAQAQAQHVQGGWDDAPAPF